MTGILILHGADVLIIDNALLARKHDKALARGSINHGLLSGYESQSGDFRNGAPPIR